VIVAILLLGYLAGVVWAKRNDLQQSYIVILAISAAGYLAGLLLSDALFTGFTLSRVFNFEF
jgi:preprotein translocase subunit SecE